MKQELPYFFDTEGECAKLAQATDWASTPLGAPENWSQSLKNTVAMVLSSKFPMFLWWGEELIQVYNDAYRPSLGIEGKHPHAMGQKGRECWPEIWDFIGPLIQLVRETGQSVWYEDLLLPIFRNGRMEDVYWTFSYSPIYGDTGVIEGVHVVCVETTAKVIGLEQIRLSKDELEFAIEAAELGTWDFNPATGSFTANARLKEWFGIAVDGEVPLDWAISVIADTDKPKVIEAIAKAIEPGSDGKYEIGYTVIHPQTKKERIVVAKGRAWFNEDGTTYRFNGTLEDLTAQKLAEREIAEIRHLSDLAIKSVGLGVFKVDFGSDTIEYTPEFAAIMTGNPDNKTLSRNTFIKHIHPEDQHLRQQAVRDGIEKGEFHYTPRVVWDDGSIHHVSITGARITDANGRPTSFSGTARDITAIEMQQKALEHAESQLHHERRENEALFRSIIEQAPVATCLFVGKDMVVEIANELMLGYWGKDPSVMGRPLLEAVPELKGQPFLKILDEVYTTGIVHSEKAAYARLADGDRMKDYYFDYTYKPLRTADGEIYGVMDMAIDVTQQVMAQKLIDEQQRKMLDSFEQAPVGIATLDRENMTFRMANAFYGELVGRTPEQLIDKPLMEAIPELEGQGFDDLLHTVLETGVAYTANEVSVGLFRNGAYEIVFVDLTYQPQRNSAEQVTGIFVVATDVTQQVLTRRDVEANEEKFRSIIMDAPMGMALFRGRELKIDVANDIILNYLGKDKSIIGRNYRDAVPELESQGFFAIMDTVYATGKSHEETDARLDLPFDGVVVSRYYNYAYTPLFDGNGEVYAIVLTAHEVTGQFTARKNLEDAQTALQNAIELAELATWKLDIKNGTYAFSQRFMDWLGFAEETQGLDDAYNPLPEEYRTQVMAAVNAVIEPGSNGIYDNEHPIINRVTGQTRIIHANAQVYYDALGNPEFLSGTAQDVTKERKLQKELEFKVGERTAALREANAELANANQALESNNLELQQFAYIASHDLQEPIRKIAIFTQMLQNQFDAISPKAKDYFDKIEHSTQRMAALIRDVLAFSQLSDTTDKFEKIDLNTIAAEITAEFELSIEQTHATVTMGDLPTIEAIPLQMSQLFGNLLSNSLKYVRPDVPPIITMSAQKLSTADKIAMDLDSNTEYCKVTFEDNGIGFEPEYEEKIFNIFQRLHGKKEYLGTGIGLAICRKIVHNHNGRITAKGNPDKGAVFCVILPFVQNG